MGQLYSRLLRTEHFHDFFSDANIHDIQCRVCRKTQYWPDRSDVTVFMQSVFSRNPCTRRDSCMNLNDEVVQRLVKEVHSGQISYERFLIDQKRSFTEPPTLPVRADHPRGFLQKCAINSCPYRGTP